MSKVFVLPDTRSPLRQEALFLARLARQIRELQELHRERSLRLAERLVDNSGLANEL